MARHQVSKGCVGKVSPHLVVKYVCCIATDIHTLSTGCESENGLYPPVRGVSQTPPCMRVVGLFS
jgi:hypothetical protein